MGVREVGVEVRRLLHQAVIERIRANRRGWARINVHVTHLAADRIQVWLDHNPYPGAGTLLALRTTLWADITVTLVGNAVRRQRRLANIESLINTIHP
jgi:hypothetical protein